MKKTLTIVSLLAGAAVSVQAQGQVQWNSSVTGWTIYVYSVNYSAPTTPTFTSETKYTTPGNGQYPVFNGSEALGGTATGSGTGATAAYNGNNYTMGLYVGSSTGAVAAALTGGSPNSTSPFNTAAGAGSAGWWATAGSQSAASPILSANAGAYSSTVYVELAAWYSGGGATSYAQAAAAANTPYGADGISSAITLNIAISVPPNLASSGLESFDLTETAAAIPEPSTIALGVMGASALLFRRRK